MYGRIRHSMKKIPALLTTRLGTRAAAAWLLVIAGLFYYPVISADVLFQDDAERITTERGSHGFMDGGRFVAEALSRVMSGFSDHPIDYGNLGQLLGILSVVAAVTL